MCTLVAAIQMTSTEDLRRNLDVATELVTRAVRRGARLVALPENFAFIGPRDEDKLAVQEPLEGPIVSRLRELARSHGVALILGGLPERSEDPARPYNTSVAIDENGDISGVYRKIHLFDVAVGPGATICESRSTSAGDRVATVQLGELEIGLSICYDLRFSALYAALVDRGANVLLVPAAFTLTTGKDHWEVLLRARAIEFQAYVVAPAQTGSHHPKRQSFGHAMIVDPWGCVIACCSEGEMICVAEIEPSRVQEVRQRLPSLRHRRPDVFGGT